MIVKRNSLVEAFKPPAVVVKDSMVDVGTLGMVVALRRSPVDLD